MRLKIASAFLLAGTVVGCANKPPPPPPMAPPPEPAPMPAPPPSSSMGPMSGTYRGTAEASGDDRRCRAPRGTQTARVRNNSITVGGLRGRIGPDGAVTGRGLSGTVNGNTADLTVTRGSCTIHYTLTSAGGSAGMGGSSSSTGSSNMGGSDMGGSDSGGGRGM